MTILLYVVENTVVYLHCMEASGEEVTKMMVREVSGEYVRVGVNVKDGDHQVDDELAEDRGC